MTMKILEGLMKTYYYGDTKIFPVGKLLSGRHLTEEQSVGFFGQH